MTNLVCCDVCGLFVTDPVHDEFHDAIAAQAGTPYEPGVQQAPPGECSYCDAERARGNTFFPSHDASPRCQSGRHNHCTCDTCF
jgi:hypothetical protein